MFYAISRLSLVLRRRLRGRQHAPQASGELLHRAFWFIGADVWRIRAFVAVGFFQHVCGNSEPVSAA
jgi:hypothetical protein